MYVFLRRAALFIFPLVFIAAILALLIYSFPEKRGPIPHILPTKNVKSMTKSVEVNQPKINRQSEKNLQDSYPTAVLDPTHGGDDAGSIGINSIVESNINLQVAFKLARALRMKGVKVFLTRTDDYNVTLERKFKDAEKQNPVIYISINCAYSDKRNKKGVEVYGFTPEPAEADGSEIEKTENKFYEFYEGTYVQKSQEAEAVEDRVSSSVKKELNLPYRSGLERRFFKFLSLPANIPALAVFVGYISNYNDSRLLSSEKEVDELTERLATAIESGITKQARLD